MSSSNEEFQVGERVVYAGLHPPELGTIINVRLEHPKEGLNSVEVRIYEIALDEGGTFTGLSRHLRCVEGRQW